MADQLRHNQGKVRWSYWFSQTDKPEQILAGANDPEIKEIGLYCCLYLNGQDGALLAALSTLATKLGGASAVAQGFCEVCVYGEGKYKRGNYRLGTSVCHYMDSALRHLLSMRDDFGALDTESGQAHWKHLAWNLCMIREQPLATRDDRLPRNQGETL